MYAGREGGQGPLNDFQKCCLWSFAILGRGLKINIFKVLFLVRRGSHKKVYALHKVDNSGRLTHREDGRKEINLFGKVYMQL